MPNYPSPFGITPSNRTRRSNFLSAVNEGGPDLSSLMPRPPQTPMAQQQQQSLPMNTPGGYSQNLQAGGVSRGYATKLALQRDRAGGFNSRESAALSQMAPAARQDITLAPHTGTSFYTPQRQGMEAVNSQIAAQTNDISQMTPVRVKMGEAQAGLGNAQAGQITGMLPYQQQAMQANTGFRNAEIAAYPGRVEVQNDIGRAQAGRYGAEGSKLEAEAGKINTETGMIGSDLDRQFKTLSEEVKLNKITIARQNQIIADYEKRLGLKQAEERNAGGGGDNGNTTKKIEDLLNPPKTTPTGGGALDMTGWDDTEADRAVESLPSGAEFIGTDGKKYRKQ